MRKNSNHTLPHTPTSFHRMLKKCSTGRKLKGQELADFLSRYYFYVSEWRAGFGYPLLSDKYESFGTFMVIDFRADGTAVILPFAPGTGWESSMSQEKIDRFSNPYPASGIYDSRDSGSLYAPEGRDIVALPSTYHEYTQQVYNWSVDKSTLELEVPINKEDPLSEKQL